MYRFIVVIVLATVAAATLSRAEECPASRFEGLVAEAKSANNNRQWDRTVELYRTMLSDCQSFVTGSDLAKAYDALAVGLLMQGNPTAALETAKKCLEQDARYNACLMTAAQASYNLGDKQGAIGYARDAIEIGNYDEYSAAIVIEAKDFLKKLGVK